MEKKIHSVWLLILWLGFFSVTIKSQHQFLLETTGSGDKKNDVANEVSHWSPIMASQPFEKFEVGKEEEDSFIVAGDHPDDGTLMTHHHVDQLMGVLTPAKRVKKILPPFEEKPPKNLNKRNALKNKTEMNKIKNPGREISQTQNNVEAKGVSQGEENNWKKEVKSNNLVKSFTDVIVGSKKKSDRKFLKSSEKTESESEIFQNENSPALFDETKESTAMSFVAAAQSDEKVVAGVGKENEGIRFIPGKHEGVETEGKEKLVGEIEKSIWDLLKERKRLEDREPDVLYERNFDPTLNKSETTTPNLIVSDTKKSLVESSKVEKHEVLSSYALGQSFNNGKQQFLSEEKKKTNESDGWIKSTEEMVRLLRLTREEYPENDVFFDVVINDQSEESKANRRPSTWFLFLLAGNLTIIQLRRNDFTKYLRVNLAARLSIEYDDVKVNMVVLIPPKILVNVTVFAPLENSAKEAEKHGRNHSGEKREKLLIKMTETNATLLELSGEEYHVTRFFSINSLKPEAHKRVKSFSKDSFLEDVEFVFYTFLGSCCACAIILLLLVSVNKYFRKVTDPGWPWQDLGSATWSTGRGDFHTTSPAVIFSGEENVGSQPLTMAASSSWTEPELSRSSVLSSLNDGVSIISRGSTKLRIYDCDANSLVLPMALQNGIQEPENSKNPSAENDLDPLDVRNRNQLPDQDCPIFPI